MTLYQLREYLYARLHRTRTGLGSAIEQQDAPLKVEPQETLAIGTVKIDSVQQQKEKFWKLYFDFVAERYDKQLMEGWMGDTNGITVFTGLFAAVVATFASASLMSKRTTALVWINILWFSSLFISIVCGFLAMKIMKMARQYVREFQNRDGRDERGPAHLGGIQRSTLSITIQVLSVLLHIALFLFCGGILVALFSVDIAVAWTITALMVIAFIFYVVLYALPYSFFGKDHSYRLHARSLVRTMRNLMLRRSTPLHTALDWEALCSALRMIVSNIEDPEEAKKVFSVITPMLTLGKDNWHPAEASTHDLAEFLVTQTKILAKLNILIGSCLFNGSRLYDEEECHHHLCSAYAFWRAIVGTIPADASAGHDAVFLALMNEYGVPEIGRPLPPLTESKLFYGKNLSFAFSSTALMAHCYANLMRNEEYRLMAAWTAGWDVEKVLELMPDHASTSDKATSARILAIASGVCKSGRQACGLCSLLYFIRDIIDFGAHVKGRAHSAAVGKFTVYELSTNNAKWWKPIFSELQKSVNVPARLNHSLDAFPNTDTPPTHTAYRGVLQLIKQLGLKDALRDDMSTGNVLHMSDDLHKSVLSTFPFLANCMEDFIAWFKRGIPGSMDMNKLEPLLLGAEPLQVSQAVARTTSSVYDVGSPSTPRRRRFHAVPLSRTGVSKSELRSISESPNENANPPTLSAPCMQSSHSTPVALRLDIPADALRRQSVNMISRGDDGRSH